MKIPALLTIFTLLMFPASAAELRPVEGAKPVFTLDALSGGQVALAAQPGRLVLVHFFATWCEPCRDEMAALNRLHARLGDRVAILAIDVGEVDLRVRRFFAENPVDFAVLLDRDKAVSKAWAVDTMPTTFLLDPALVLHRIAEGDYAWDTFHAEDALALIGALRKP